MQNSQVASERIRLQAKSKNISLKQMLTDVSLGINTISKMANGTDVVTNSITKMADYLDCSVDYLLGRTDNPQAHKVPTVSVGNVSNNSGIIGGIGNNAPISISGSEGVNKSQKTELMETYDKLPPLKQAKLLVYAAELAEE